MVEAMIKNSIIYRMIVCYNKLISESWSSSVTSNIYTSIAAKFKDIWNYSILKRILSCFFNYDIDWNESFFYRVFTRPFKAVINYFSTMYADDVQMSITESKFIRILNNSKESIVKNITSGLGIFIAIMFGIYSLMAYLYDGVVIDFYTKAAIAGCICGILLLLIGNKMNTAIKNSFVVKIVKNILYDFWSSED